MNRVELESERPDDELRSIVYDTLIDLSQGYIGDEDDWATFEVRTVRTVTAAEGSQEGGA